MASKTVRGALVLLIAFGLLSLEYIRVSALPQTLDLDRDHPASQTGSLYEQHIDPNGKLFISSRRDPDGSDYDQYVWDDFILPSSGTITEINWYGGYDPLQGRGGPVVDFTISIYPSIAGETDPTLCG